MHEWINLAFYFWAKSSRYSEKHERNTNEALNFKNKILECKDEIKIKYDKLSMFGINQDKYLIPTEAVCLTSRIESILSVLDVS